MSKREGLQNIGLMVGLVVANFVLFGALGFLVYQIWSAVIEKSGIEVSLPDCRNDGTFEICVSSKDSP